MNLQIEKDTSGTDKPLISDREEIRFARDLAGARLRIRELEARLAGQVEARAELLNLVCHELRTPITVMSGFSKLLQSEVVGSLNEEQRRFVNEGLKACRRLDLFVGDLIDARPDSATPFEVVVAEADLHETIEGSIESLTPLLEERGLEIEMSLRAEEPMLRFDVRRIEQVITNLMTNALRYGSSPGVVRLATRSCEVILGGALQAAVEVSVEDDGPGIPAVDRERLFAAYVRGDSVRGNVSGEHAKDTVGLGIGLAISRRIIDAHGGRIWVEAGELAGARFVLHLPRTRCANGGD